MQKKIQSLKTNELVRKDLAGYDIMQEERQKFEEQYDHKDFRDYDSVQVPLYLFIYLEYKRSTHHRRYKMLEHDTKLVIEENNMLVHQVRVV